MPEGLLPVFGRELQVGDVLPAGRVRRLIYHGQPRQVWAVLDDESWRRVGFEETLVVARNRPAVECCEGMGV